MRSQLAIPTGQLVPGGLNANVVKLDRDSPEFSKQVGALRYQADLGRDTQLESLIVNQESDLLVVSFHGALNRKIYTLPRFERLATLSNTRFSSMFFSDPSLTWDPQIQLSWFTGWEEMNLHKLIAKWIQKAMKDLGCTRAIISGSSGGGFAALQVSRLIPESVALVFNPQTQLDKYYVSGKLRGISSQKKFLEVVYPQLLSVDGELPQDWGEKVGERASALKSYSGPIENCVLYCTSPRDFHHRQHYAPFMKAAEEAGNQDRIHTYEYDDGPGHHPPSTESFLTALEKAVTFTNQDES